MFVKKDKPMHTNDISTAAITLWIALGAFASQAAAENVLFVSPQGNDAWSGRVAAPADDGADGPLATLHKAVESSRRQAAGQPRRIRIHAGEYYVGQPIDLGPEDAGLTIEASEGAEVVLYGGRQITGWRRMAIDCGRPICPT